MSMSHRRVVFFVLVFVLATASAFGQPQWKIKGDNGETVNVLPPPAAVQAQENHGWGTQIPMAMNGYSVFSSSYGDNPGLLSDHGGSVISNASFFAIYYNSQPASTLQSGINSFVNNFSGSDPGMKVITQYSKAGNAISATLGNSGSFVDSKPTPSKISDTQIQSYLAGLFNAGSVAFATGRIYGVYLPQGTVSTQGRYRSCTNYCGYHSSFLQRTDGHLRRLSVQQLLRLLALRQDRPRHGNDRDLARDPRSDHRPGERVVGIDLGLRGRRQVRVAQPLSADGRRLGAARVFERAGRLAARLRHPVISSRR